MTWVWGIAAVLVLWAGITAMRRTTEEEVPNTENRKPKTVSDDDDIDYAALEEAERDVQDLDVLQKPEDGFLGDDWGPGAGKPRSPG